jgi:hypothetical protein
MCCRLETAEDKGERDPGSAHHDGALFVRSISVDARLRQCADAGLLPGVVRNRLAVGRQDLKMMKARLHS